MNESMDFWSEASSQPPATVMSGGIELRQGSRVILRPQGRGDIIDLALSGRLARVERIERDLEGKIHLAVTLDDDPGRDLGEGRYPGHRFFFSVGEVEPVEEAVTQEARYRILVAGIGNVFLGDDGFGSEVAKRLAERAIPRGVDVKDFGIRGMDLAYALQDGYDAAILIDAMPRGQPPGTLFVLEPEIETDGVVSLDTHGMDPVKVLRLARSMGGTLPRTLVVGCEPLTVILGEDYDDMRMELSEPVLAAIDGAVGIVGSLIEELTGTGAGTGAEPDRGPPPPEPGQR